jgi:DNA-binding CsgD family transcriptional regulator
LAGTDESERRGGRTTLRLRPTPSYTTLGDVTSTYWQALYEHLLTDTSPRLGDEAFQRAWEAGRLAPEQAPGLLAPLTAPPTDRPDGLTPRELEVVGLVAEGLTDAQVAERLFVSLRTVNAHLRSIYRKLDVRSRSAATRYAVEQGTRRPSCLATRRRKIGNRFGSSADVTTSLAPQPWRMQRSASGGREKEGSERCFARSNSSPSPSGTAIAAPVGLAGVGVSASEVKAGTTAVCSHLTRPSTAWGSGVPARLAESMGGSPYPQTTGSDGFDWQDAGIGAAFVAGLSMLGVAGFLAVRRRHGLAQLDA